MASEGKGVQEHLIRNLHVVPEIGAPHNAITEEIVVAEGDVPIHQMCPKNVHGVLVDPKGLLLSQPTIE
jgi:hypothetical protein